MDARDAAPLPPDDNGDGFALPPPPDDADVITEGCYVVLDQHQQDEKISLLAVHRDGYVAVSCAARVCAVPCLTRLPRCLACPHSAARLGAANVSLAPLLGCPFGSCFELADGTLRRAPPLELALPEVEADGRSNKALVDDGTAQARRRSAARGCTAAVAARCLALCAHARTARSRHAGAYGGADSGHAAQGRVWRGYCVRTGGQQLDV